MPSNSPSGKKPSYLPPTHP